MKIITGCNLYIDIDAYAGCIAYAELLRAQGIEATAVSTGIWNESIPATVRSWGGQLDTEYVPSESDTYTVIDLSNPKFFDTIVALDRVEEVIDHHVGFEKYWVERIGEKADIEYVGAACTQIYERWASATMLEEVSETSARLLICGILDNTLNFGAKITTERDRAAYDALLPYANLPDDWTERYFAECQQTMLADMSTAIRNDVKKMRFRTYNYPVYVGQMVVWDGVAVIHEYHEQMVDALRGMGESWLLNVISIRDGKSYIYASDDRLRVWVAGLLDVKFDGELGVAQHMWLRKEIINQDMGER